MITMCAKIKKNIYFIVSYTLENDEHIALARNTSIAVADN